VGDVTDDRALAALCRDEHPRLVGLLALYVGSRPVAEDLAQEAVASVVDGVPSFGDVADDPTAP
jgi:DNA-directed RNA polymerase specialized sigma24 family protein